MANSLPRDSPTASERHVLQLASYIGGAGFATGGAFSLYIGIAQHTRELAELRPARFALAGAALAGALSTIFGGCVVGAAARGWVTGFGTVQHARRVVGADAPARRPIQARPRPVPSSPA